MTMQPDTPEQNPFAAPSAPGEATNDEYKDQGAVGPSVLSLLREIGSDARMVGFVAIGMAVLGAYQVISAFFRSDVRPDLPFVAVRWGGVATVAVVGFAVLCLGFSQRINVCLRSYGTGHFREALRAQLAIWRTWAELDPGNWARG